MSAYSFQLAGIADLDRVMRLLSDARAWHSGRKVSLWPVYDPDVVRQEIDDGIVFVLREDAMIIGTAVVLEADPLIWKGDTPAFYIHRLATDRDLKGRGLCRRMIDAIDRRAQDKGKAVLRLDCWADNEELKAFYQTLGFEKLGNLEMGEARSLPAHYWNSVTTLFERRVRTHDHAELVTAGTDTGAPA